MNQDTSEVAAVRELLVQHRIRAEIVVAEGNRPRVWVPKQDLHRAMRLIMLMPNAIGNGTREASSCDECESLNQGFDSCWTCARA